MRNKTYSRTSPRGGKRGCLCWDSNTYSRKCCDGSLQAQGIGVVILPPAFSSVKWESISQQWQDINDTWN